jgi:hypothetical protein
MGMGLLKVLELKIWLDLVLVNKKVTLLVQVYNLVLVLMWYLLLGKVLVKCLVLEKRADI